MPTGRRRPGGPACCGHDRAVVSSDHPVPPDPRRPLHRRRINAALDAALVNRYVMPVITITAPAGAGKTTALLHWLAHRSDPAPILYLHLSVVGIVPVWCSLSSLQAAIRATATQGAGTTAGGSQLGASPWPLPEIVSLVDLAISAVGEAEPPILIVDGVDRGITAHTLRRLLALIQRPDQPNRSRQLPVRLITAGRYRWQARRLRPSLQSSQPTTWQ
jgi:hypothetical protein